MIGRVNAKILRPKGISSLLVPTTGAISSSCRQPLTNTGITCPQRPNEQNSNSLRNLVTMKKTKGQPLSKRFFHTPTSLSMRKRSEDFYGVPYAYMERREKRDKDEGKENGRMKGKRMMKGGRHGMRTKNTRKKSYSYQSTGTGDKRSGSLVVDDKKNFARAQEHMEKLMDIDDEVKELMNSYQEELGTSIHVNGNEIQSTSTSTSTDNADTVASKLIATEDVFRNVCIKQRQLVAGWSLMRPLQQNPLWKWSDDAEKNTLPPVLAFNTIKELESLRQRRADLIKSSLLTGDKDTNEGTGMFQWLSTNLLGLSGSPNSKQESQKTSHLPRTLDELTAHTSSDFTASRHLYNGILNSYDSWKDFIPKEFFPTQIEEVLSCMNYNVTSGNPNVKPDTKVYSHLIKCHQHSKELNDAKKTVEILHKMIEQTRADDQNGIEAICRPTPTTFDDALSAFYDVASKAQGKNNDLITTAIVEAEKVLTLMEQQGPNNEETRVKNEAEIDSTFAIEKMRPYRTMLKLYRLGRPSFLTNYAKRIEHLMVGMIGKEASEKLLSSDGDIVTPKINHDVLQDFVNAFAISKDRESLNKAKNLLEKMEKTRAVALQNDSKLHSWNTKYPLATSYNAVIMGYVLSGDDIIAQNVRSKRSLSKEKKSLYEDAINAMGLLDSMLQNESSLPQLYTYSRLVRLFANSMSRKAGIRAEEILSRMEMYDAFSIESKSIKDADLGVKIKQAALECWAVSAAAGLPGAAKSASSLFHRMDERLNDELGDSERRQAKIFFYNAVIKACSETRIHSDKAEALNIAFDMYNRICDDGITPTSTTFALLLQCCQLLPPSSQDQVMLLSKEILSEACSSGLVGKHLLSVLRKVNNNLYEAYKSKPEHSEAFNQMNNRKKVTK